MKSIVLFLVTAMFIISCFSSIAQFYFYNDKYYDTRWVFELGGSMGIMNSFTDIGGKKGVGKQFIKDLNWKVCKPTASAYAAATWRDLVSLKLEATFGNIGCYDSILRNVGPSTFGRYERNLSFRTAISDLMFAAEFHPFFLKTYDEDDPPPLLSPYLLMGIGYFSFNPEAQLHGQWYSLKPLHTEGQGFKEYPDRENYALSQINFPAGAGLRYELSATIVTRLELIYRILFTDYLDDVSEMDYVDPSLFNVYLPPQQASIARQLYDRRNYQTKGAQRGNPKRNDSFFTIQLKIGLRFRPRVRNSGH